LSVEAVHARLICVAEDIVAVRLEGAVGASVSDGDPEGAKAQPDNKKLKHTLIKPAKKELGLA
jgi:hypothetical protein